MTLLAFTLAASALLHPELRDGEVDVAVQLDVHADRVEVRYTIETSENTIREEIARLGAGEPGVGLANALASYAVALAASLAERLELRIDGRPLTLGGAQGRIASGHHAGVEVRLTAEFDDQVAPGVSHTLSFDDANFLPIAEDGAPAWRGSYRLAVRQRDDRVALLESESAEIVARAVPIEVDPNAVEAALASHATEAVFQIDGDGEQSDAAPFRFPVLVLAVVCLLGLAAAVTASRTRGGSQPR